jgi:hypothetical protein
MKQQKRRRVDIYKLIEECDAYKPIEIIAGDIRTRISEDRFFDLVLKAYNKHIWSARNFLHGMLLSYCKDKKKGEIFIMTPRQWGYLLGIGERGINRDAKRRPNPAIM